MTMATDSQSKPEYLGLLNAISVAESRAGMYLKAWADVTPDPDLKRALALVAARETSHGEVFCQRIERLGFALRDREDPKFAEQLRIYGDPTVSDHEKIRYGRYGQGDGQTERIFASIDERVADESVDPLTRDTLRWYVHEERDSTALLNEAYACVEAKAGTGGAGSDGRTSMVSADAQALMACMTEGFTALQRSIKDLTEALGRAEKPKSRSAAQP